MTKNKFIAWWQKKHGAVQQRTSRRWQQEDIVHPSEIFGEEVFEELKKDGYKIVKVENE